MHSIFLSNFDHFVDKIVIEIILIIRLIFLLLEIRDKQSQHLYHLSQILNRASLLFLKHFSYFDCFIPILLCIHLLMPALLSLALHAG